PSPEVPRKGTPRNRTPRLFAESALRSLKHPFLNIVYRRPQSTAIDNPSPIEKQEATTAKFQVLRSQSNPLWHHPRAKCSAAITHFGRNVTALIAQCAHTAIQSDPLQTRM